MSTEIAYLIFISQDWMNQFVTVTYGQTPLTGEILSDREYSQGNGATEGKDSERREKQEFKYVGRYIFMYLY